MRWMHLLNGWLRQYLTIFTVFAIIRLKTKSYNQQHTYTTSQWWNVTKYIYSNTAPNYIATNYGII